MLSSDQNEMSNSRNSDTMTDVIIIGAGPAGLSVAEELDQRGIQATILERGKQAGQRWADRYEGLSLNTPGWLSDLPGYRLRLRAGQFPSRKQWTEYLQDYAKHFELNIRFETEVKYIEQINDGWLLSTSEGPMECQYLIVATGHDNEPVVPPWEGLDEFTGRFLHSDNYQKPDLYRDKRVLVVGAGNSGCEIAKILADAECQEVLISVRRFPLILPETILGISSTAWGLVTKMLPDMVIDRVGWVQQRISFGDLSPYGLPPTSKRLSDMRYHYYAPVIDRGFVDAVKGGTVEVVSAVRAFDGSEVLLEDESTIQPDAVISATGYQPGLEDMFKHSDFLDEQGEPRLREDRSARGVYNLFFAGFQFGLLAVLPYIKQDAHTIAEAISNGI